MYTLHELIIQICVIVTCAIIMSDFARLRASCVSFFGLAVKKTPFDGQLLLIGGQVMGSWAPRVRVYQLGP